MDSSVFVKSLIGKPLLEASSLIEDQEMISRITKKDGYSFVVTRDYKTNRVNLSIENNIVVEASIG
jgi:hypothetical protein